MFSTLLLILAAGCGTEVDGPPPEIRSDAASAGARLEAADKLLKRGDFEGARAALLEVKGGGAKVPEAACGLAWIAMMQGDAEAAAKLLREAAEAGGGGDVRLRQAMVAASLKDFDGVRSYGEESGLAAGRLMAAEAALADAETEEAARLLSLVVADDSAVGETAARYLELVEDPDPSVAGLAENYALWALGERHIAVKSVAPLIRAIGENDWKTTELLVWAGRAAAIGEAQAASDMLDSIAFPPKGQAWRVRATRAIIHCAEGDAARCKLGLDQLRGAAPPTGLLHARATAAMALGPEQKEAALALLDDRVSEATARAAMALGAPREAMRLAPEGMMKEMMGGGG